MQKRKYAPCDTLLISRVEGVCTIMIVEKGSKEMKITSLNYAGIDWGIDTKEMEFKKCKELPLDTVLTLRGVFTTPDNGYGPGAVAILDEKLVNLPIRYFDTVEIILNDPEMIEEIKSGKVGIIVSEFMSKKYKKIGYDVTFVEV